MENALLCANCKLPREDINFEINKILLKSNASLKPQIIVEYRKQQLTHSTRPVGNVALTREKKKTNEKIRQIYGRLKIDFSIRSPKLINSILSSGRPPQRISIGWVCWFSLFVFANFREFQRDRTFVSVARCVFSHTHWWPIESTQ